jgi:hypothetical protein
MRTRILAAVVAALSALALATPALAGLNQKANHLRAQVVKRFGADAAGRDIIRLGVMTKHGVRPAPRAVKRRYVDVLTRTLHPPTNVPTSAPRSAHGAAAPAASSGGGAGGELASIRACESHGVYTTNTHNGFSGAYQFTDETWKAAGGSTEHAYQASPAEQDRIAARWLPGHRSAWPNC